MKTNEISLERLKQVIEYHHETGVFVWRITLSSRAQSGMIASSDDGRGYKRICIDGMRYKAHRLAWLYAYGVWPDGCIDHVNGNPSDNRIKNLRCVTLSGNAQNQRVAHRNNKSSGLLGAYPAANKTNPWKAAIQINGKTTYIGQYKTKEEAHLAYLAEKRKHHTTCEI